MIAPNEKPEPKLTSKDMHAVLCICVKLAGGIAIPAAKLESFPKDIKLKAAYNETDKRWYFDVSVPRKRGIVKPKRKIILSGRN